MDSWTLGGLPGKALASMRKMSQLSWRWTKLVFYCTSLHGLGCQMTCKMTFPRARCMQTLCVKTLSEQRPFTHTHWSIHLPICPAKYRSGMCKLQTASWYNLPGADWDWFPDGYTSSSLQMIVPVVAWPWPPFPSFLPSSFPDPLTGPIAKWL